MLPEDAGWLRLMARRESPHHLQVRVSGIRRCADKDFRFRRIDAEVFHVFRSGNGHDARRIQPGDSISFGIEYVVRRDPPPLVWPFGAMTVWLEYLESARFLEVFLERDLMVPACQVKPIEGPTAVPRMTLDDPDLLRWASMYEWRQRKHREFQRIRTRKHAFVSRAVREHVADEFAAGDVAVFQYGDTYVARIMLPHVHPNDLGSLRRFVKAERRAGRVSAADERVCCTRDSVAQRIVYELGTAYFLA